MEFFERLADLIDGVVLLAERDGEGVCLGFSGRGVRRVGGGEETRLGVATELMAQDAEGAWGIAEGARGLVRRHVSDEEGAKGFVHTLLWVAWSQEKAAAVC